MKYPLILLFFTWGLNAFAELPSPELLVRVGEQKVIHRDLRGGGLTVINPKVAKVSVENKSIRIIGRETGEAHLVTSTQNIKLVVYSSTLTPVKELIDAWVQNVAGIKAEIKPKKIVLHGIAFRLSDWRVIQDFKKRFPTLVQSEVTITENLRGSLKTSILSSLKEKSIISANLQDRDGKLSLSTSAKKKDERAAIREVADQWGLSPAEINQNVELRPMVEINIIIAEMKKNVAQSLGLQLPGTYSATILPSSDLSSFATTFDGINPQFHASLIEGMGKVLANPRLVCRSGEVAHFVAGGEIPIKIRSRFEADVIWKRYGVILDITPVADLNDGISTGLVTEISLLDSAHTIDGIPGLLTNRIETHFDLRGSKTIALSGLIKSETGRDSSTTPLLGEIPVIGELFKSRDFKENRTELVVFVTPKVISPESPPPPPALPHWEDDP